MGRDLDEVLHELVQLGNLLAQHFGLDIAVAHLQIAPLHCIVQVAVLFDELVVGDLHFLFLNIFSAGLPNFRIALY